MLEDKLYIDGEDAFVNYGVFVEEEGYNELVAFPPLKSVKYNDWQEKDGIEVDLSSPILDTREFAMKFSFAGEQALFENFMQALASGAYHTFYCKEIGRTYILRMVSHSDMDLACGACSITVRFADDYPLRGYTYVAPSSSIPEYNDYAIDDALLTTYGCRVLEGSLAEIKKKPAEKTNLLRNISIQSGAIYDGQTVTFKSKDVKINCLMRASTLAELWQNYDALLYNLTQPGERSLYCATTGLSYPCYYESCSVSEFYATGKIWLKFSLVLVFTGPGVVKS